MIIDIYLNYLKSPEEDAENETQVYEIIKTWIPNLKSFADLFILK